MALGAVALSASACSQTDRFAYDPFSNPFNGKETPAYTGTVNSAPSGSISSEPLPPPGGGYQSSNYTPPAPAAYAAQPQRNYTPYQPPGGYQQASAPSAPPAQPAPLPQYKYNPQAGWGAEGGQTIVVKQGDTPYSLGARHGIPASAILEANKLPAGASLTPGQRIVVPAYKAQAKGGNAQQVAAAPRAEQKPRPAQAAKTAARGGSHTVQSGETLFSISRTYNVPPRELAEANQVGLDYRVRVGETMTIPGEGRVAVAAAPQRPRDPELQPEVVKPVYKAEEAPKTEPAVAQPQQAYAATAKPSPAESSTGGSDFRWPVRGRVISGFGAKPNGQTNDGVNISVPEGTEIKAAEGGVVAYAGNELKGFGNLVLIRHQGEWVTAYAHASELLVKRGDVVRRGQTIARSGKSGNVTSPQLHFEVRRGASPVDPMDYLPQG